MNRIEQIRDNVKNVTDWYADNGLFVEDIEFLLSEVERLQNELKVFINHSCEKMGSNVDVKSYYDHENKETIHYCHYCGETLKKEPTPE